MMRYFFRPLKANPLRMLNLKKLADLLSMVRPDDREPLVYVDNRALDGFMERFMEKGCRDEDCEKCRWCHDFAEKAVRMEEDRRRLAIDACGEIFRSLHEGDMWRYLPAKKVQ